ncbi:MAG: hypothetical protein K940chlam2_01272 [Chlamydiae bacterium]|nr:hypothetical protein [Chlamydiota bacterium]
MRLLLLSLLLLSACSRTTNWQVQNLPARAHCFESARLIYRSCDRSCGIDIELLSGPDLLATYLQVTSGYIPCNPEDPATSKVTLRGKTRSLTVDAERHAGGQRLRLPQVAQEFFLTALERGEPFCLELPGYVEPVDSAGFARAFAKMLHPGLRLPFHFPY